MTIEQLCRDILQQAIADGLVLENPQKHPQQATSGDLVAVANMVQAYVKAMPFDHPIGDQELWRMSQD